jgi:hypothetical protein
VGIRAETPQTIQTLVCIENAAQARLYRAGYRGCLSPKWFDMYCPRTPQFARPPPPLRVYGGCLQLYLR